MAEGMNAEQFLQKLDEYRPPKEKETSERGLASDEEHESVGIPMRQIFALAKQFSAMPPGEIETLLDSHATTYALAR